MKSEKCFATRATTQAHWHGLSQFDDCTLHFEVLVVRGEVARNSLWEPDSGDPQASADSAPTGRDGLRSGPAGGV